MSSEAATRRLRAYTQIIWEDENLILDTETDDCGNYMAYVGKDFSWISSPLVMTNICRGQGAAWRELERMLEIWASYTQSGQPITDKQRREIHGGPNGEYKKLLKKVDKYFEEHPEELRK